MCVLTSVAGDAPLARSALLAYPGFSQSPKGLGSTQTRSVAPQQLGAWAIPPRNAPHQNDQCDLAIIGETWIAGRANDGVERERITDT